MRTLVLALVALLLSCTTTKEIYVKDHYSARKSIGESVYRVTDKDGWGTGFAAKTKSGKTVVVTNDHVCEGLTDTARLRAGGKAWKVKIIERYSKHDLCLLAAPKGAKALEIADSKPEYREKIYTAGFPIIPDMTESSGEALSMDKDPLMYGPGDPATCKGEKFRIEMKQLPPFGMMAPVCMLIAPFQNTSVQSDEGASGSPVVNKKSKVVGVISVVKGNIALAGMVPHSYVKDLLSKY
jgi:S1-C subfamily serine protease